ncbi:Insulin-like growth factor-binding protein complex acid labile subunit [Eumeta japonica]|uniref:Insulin-like growth factor-binding protein complex acid labile subunit n=1 Tax=Eumeta variegata TaxID=151549 RepID=A0A4C1TF09_EUMVA|nr:Insulin-like growth factor-binding protein complex acid labile subunit [Eumeta japonica]
MKLLMIECVVLTLTMISLEVATLYYPADAVCDVCSCSADYSTIDCTQRALIDVPDIPTGISSKVKNLNLSNNDVTTIPEWFGRLYELVNLDLSTNRMSALQKDALSNLTKLQVFNISRNHFQNWMQLYPDEVLKSAESLKVLDISHNSLGSIDYLTNQELLVSSTLETLILEDCGISSIRGKSPLSGLTNIRVLKLSHNPLRRIEGLVSSTLKSLDLSHCQLSYIRHDQSLYTPSLIHLNVAHNTAFSLYYIEILELDSLRYLDASYCRIMQPGLRGFPNLRKATLSHNMIRIIEQNEFLNNSKLEYLDLSYNNIASVRDETFTGLHSIKYLDLSWNEIGDIPEAALIKMPTVTHINLSRNYISRMGHLKSKTLRILDMSACEIDRISKDSFEGLNSLIDINLSRNLISHIPDSISSNTVKHLNLNYNRISSVNNFTFFMLPRLTTLSLIGNRFTTVWKKSYFQSNPYLERIEISDNMWRCDCADINMYEFHEYLTLEPDRKEEMNNLLCHSPPELFGQNWFEACYFIWFPNQKSTNTEGLLWFIVVMIVGLLVCFVLITAIRRAMKRRLATIQAERVRQVEEARERLRVLRIRAEQEAQCNAPDPRDLISPPSYDEALNMPKLSLSCHSLNETASTKSRKRRGRRKTKSTNDILEAGENEELQTLSNLNAIDSDNESETTRRRRRNRRYGSHEITELDNSPGARRRQQQIDTNDADAITVEVEAELERPLRPRNRRHSLQAATENNAIRESDF